MSENENQKINHQLYKGGDMSNSRISNASDSNSKDQQNKKGDNKSSHWTQNAMNLMFRYRWQCLAGFAAIGSFSTAYFFRQQIQGQSLEFYKWLTIPQPNSIISKITPNNSAANEQTEKHPFIDQMASFMMVGLVLSGFHYTYEWFTSRTYNVKKTSDIEQESGKTFDDVGGCEKAKEAILEIIDFIKVPEMYQNMGLKMPKGVLLCGPPGTGKTLIAKAAAKEAGIPFIFTSGSEFVEIYVGNGARKIRELFNHARNLKSAVIIFIDEIDALGYKRGQIGQSNREQEQTLNQLLNEMDGFFENDKIIVVAATNIPESLDSALTRPGRFDRKVEVPLPEVTERQKIFQIHLKNKPHNMSTQDMSEAAKKMEGYSGADIEQIVNRAGIQLVRTTRLKKSTTAPQITKKEILETIEEYKNERSRGSRHGLLNPQNQYMKFV